MDFDPLADNAPPRYAIESDDEEDEYNPLNPSRSNPSDGLANLSVNFQGSVPKKTSLIVATGDAGKYWAQGARLGEQTGSVHANNVEVGLVFSPTWTSAIIIISEALTRLPIWAQHTYALEIIKHFEPTRLALLDAYSTPTYASFKPIPAHEAPIRYLATTPLIALKIQAEAEPFGLPNLVQSTSASFMSIITSSDPTQGVLVLLPSPRVPPSAPEKILPGRLSSQSDHWPTNLLLKTHQLLSVVVGEESYPEWALEERKEQFQTFNRNSEVSDGGLYI